METNASGFERAFQRIATIARRTFDAEAAAVYLAEAEQWTCVACVGRRSNVACPSSPPDDDLLRHVLDQSGPVLLPDVDHRWPASRLFRDWRMPPSDAATDDAPAENPGPRSSRAREPRAHGSTAPRSGPFRATGVGAAVRIGPASTPNGILVVKGVPARFAHGDAADRRQADAALATLADVADLAATLDADSLQRPLPRPGVGSDTGLAFIEWDDQFRVVDWSAAAERIFGYTAEEARGLHGSTIIPTDVWPRVKSIWDGQLGKSGGYFSRNPNLTRDGRVIVCEWHNTPLVDDDGTVRGVISLAKNVTDQEHAAQVLQESRAFSENLIVAMQDGVSVVDARHVTVQVNDAFCEMTGFAREDLLGTTPPYPYWPPEEYDTLRAAFRHIVTDGRAAGDLELTFVRSDGTRFPVIVSPATLYDADDTAVAHFATIKDITDRKRAEEQLARERELLQRVFDTLPVMIVVDDVDQGLRANRAFEANVGRRPMHPVDPGEDAPTLVLNPDDPGSIDALFACLRGEAADDAWVDLHVGPQDGGVDTTWTAFGLSDGTRIALGIDVTEQRRREHELQRAKNDAEEMNRLKSAFLANMSHEIRTPLTAILGFADIIGEEITDTEAGRQKVVRFAQLIRRGGQRLLKTLNAVLDLSRLEAGVMNLTPDWVDVAAEAEAVVEEQRPVAQAAGVALQLDRPATPTSVELDASAFRRILGNVVDNALKFTPFGGRVTVRVREVEAEGRRAARVEVEDTGIGIDAAFLSRIFDPFEQESSGPNRSHEGTGVGLAVTQHLVRLMNGAITVDSAKGEGTRVVLLLPSERA